MKLNVDVTIYAFVIYKGMRKAAYIYIATYSYLTIFKIFTVSNYNLKKYVVFYYSLKEILLME